MGMYDEVIIECPNCFKHFKEQSKAGDCVLQTYWIHDAPLLIVADMQKDSENGKLSCPHCGCKVAIHTECFVNVKIKNSHLYRA